MCSTVNKIKIKYGHGSHCLYDGHCTWQYAWVMATAGFQCGVYPIYVDRMLFHKYGGYRLECNAEEDILSVADAALDTAGVIGFRFNTSAVIEEYVILFRTFFASGL